MGDEDAAQFLETARRLEQIIREWPLLCQMVKLIYDQEKKRSDEEESLKTQIQQWADAKSFWSRHC